VPVDRIRIGLSFRALRIRRRWRQEDLAARAGVSRSLIARLERGGVDRLALRRLERIADELGARVEVRVLWQGEALDRLLDARHAALVESVVRFLRAADWEVATEVSFNERGERG
jgi:transcriptional regulator with XRE-family HTH domain